MKYLSRLLRCRRVKLSKVFTARMGIWTPDAVLALIDFSSYTDLYPGYSRAVDDDEETYFESREGAYEAADRVISMFEALPDPIPVFRSIQAEDESEIDLDYPGQCWSFSRESAIQFGSHAGANFLMSAEVAKSDVDWETTFRAYWEFSGGGADSEDEITVADETKIQNIRLSKLK